MPFFFWWVISCQFFFFCKLLPSFCYASTIPRVSQKSVGKIQSLQWTPWQMTQAPSWHCSAGTAPAWTRSRGSGLAAAAASSGPSPSSRALATTVSQQPEAPATAAKHPRAPQQSWQLTNIQVIKFLSGRHDLTQEKLVETKGLDPSNTHFFLHLMKGSNECSSIALVCWKKSVLYMLKNKSNN